ncbi:hypothetical protein L9F63_010943, partial [Diploptera punctata]
FQKYYWMPEIKRRRGLFAPTLIVQFCCNFSGIQFRQQYKVYRVPYHKRKYKSFSAKSLKMESLFIRSFLSGSLHAGVDDSSIRNASLQPKMFIEMTRLKVLFYRRSPIISLQIELTSLNDCYIKF